MVLLIDYALLTLMSQNHQNSIIKNYLHEKKITSVFCCVFCYCIL